MNAEVAVVRSMADVSETLLRIVGALRDLNGVRGASSSFWLRAEELVGEDQFRVGEGAGFRLEWYAEAEFLDGRTLTFSQEAAWHDGEWVVDASARSVVDGEETVVLELPRRFAVTADDVIAELRGQSRMLEDRFDQAVRAAEHPDPA